MATSAENEFSFNTRLGLVFVVQASFFSAIAVTAVLIYIGYKTVKHRWRTEIDIQFYFVNLMIFDLIMSLGSMFDIKWIKDARVIDGPVCRAQGPIKQFGNVGVALTSLAITIHTLCVLVFRLYASRKVVLAIIACIWLFVILIISISFGVHKGTVTYRGQTYHYYGDTRDWCWITQPYVEKQGIGLEYFWLWLAAAVDLVVYVYLAYLFMRPTGVDSSHTQRSTAMRLLLYPFVYLVTVLPQSVARWTRFASDGSSNAPAWFTFTAAVLFSLNGLFNVILFALTRPGVFSGRSGSETARADDDKESGTRSN